MLTDAQLAAALDASPGERVTEAYMRSRIRDIAYVVRPQGTTLTICVLTLDNGFTATGEAACVDPANFNEEIGRKIAFDNAFNKLWPLFGFLLAEMRFRARRLGQT